MKNKIISARNGDQRYLNNNDIKHIADYLNVKEDDVIEMDKRLNNAEISINSPMKNNDETGNELGDLLPARIAPQDVILDTKREKEKRMSLLKKAIENTLNEREKDILYKRRLTDKPLLLKDLGDKYSITQERVRQIEEGAVKKIQKYIQENS
jgi:RNA polymerase sigma-32 factor